VIANDTNAGAPTVKVAVPLMLPEAAVIVDCPAASGDAKPELLMLATFAADEVQVTDVVRVCVLPSL
jgi:hypothetical protein